MPRDVDEATQLCPLDLTAEVSINAPHVVLLGAGASKAAFPHGDASGRCVPLMNELCDAIPEIHDCFNRAGMQEPFDDFENLYCELLDRGEVDVAKEIENIICKYFSALTLPYDPTLYDYLVLSLRPKDAILTFNWDPFLLDAWIRNRAAFPDLLPQIYFLHGNVRVGSCDKHDTWGLNGERCVECRKPWTPTQLLYPVRDKNYGATPYLKGQWDRARTLLRDAFIFTVFGYGAPSTDAKAVDLLHEAWRARGEHPVKRIVVIDRPGMTELEQDQLHEKWSRFPFFHHVEYLFRFQDSFLSLFPRRTCENLSHAGFEGRPSECSIPPADVDLQELQNWFRQLTVHEPSATTN